MDNISLSSLTPGNQPQQMAGFNVNDMFCHSIYPAVLPIIRVIWHFQYVAWSYITVKSASLKWWFSIKFGEHILAIKILFLNLKNMHCMQTVYANSPGTHPCPLWVLAIEIRYTFGVLTLEHRNVRDCKSSFAPYTSRAPPVFMK